MALSTANQGGQGKFSLFGLSLGLEICGIKLVGLLGNDGFDLNYPRLITHRLEKEKGYTRSSQILRVIYAKSHLFIDNVYRREST